MTKSSRDAAMGILIRKIRPEKLEEVLDRPASIWGGLSARQLLDSDPDRLLADLEQMFNREASF
jgi:hypothetical protein